MNDEKSKYINEFKLNLLDKANTKNDIDTVKMIILDIKWYIFHENNEYTTTEHIIGMEFIFQGWVVKLEEY